MECKCFPNMPALLQAATPAAPPLQTPKEAKCLGLSLSSHSTLGD